MHPFARRTGGHQAASEAGLSPFLPRHIRLYSRQRAGPSIFCGSGTAVSQALGRSARALAARAAYKRELALRLTDQSALSAARTNDSRLRADEERAAAPMEQLKVQTSSCKGTRS